MSAIEGRGITLRYGAVAVVDAVDIAVDQGAIRGLIGPNGAGKSTLIDVLSGRANPSNGQILLEGRDISAMSVQARHAHGLARSFQRINIFPDITVRQQLEVAARIARLDNTDEVVDQLDLRVHLDDIAGLISYGHQRRLDLALALVGRPKVLLLDEPSAGLTVAESRALADILRQLTRRWEVAVLIVEHDMEVVFSICDRITVLNLGKVLAEGPPDEVRRDQRVRTAYLGSAA